MITITPEMMALFRECCSFKASALILNPETNFVCHAHFASVSQDSVTFHLINRVRQLLKAPRLFISFSQNGICNAFFAAIVEYKDNLPLSPESISVQLATKIYGMETRVSYRFPIRGREGLFVRLLLANGRTLFPKPIDLSLTGILIEFDETEDPDLLSPSEVELELRLEAHSVQLKAVIKRRDGHRYGLFFPETVTSGGINAPSSLRLITMALERALLQVK
ncbi:MAG: PilZ domain-containing protein [Acidobacteria bacterium]|nr:PilZ domain-containing protein [Acidobacteriota bacterium]